MILIYNINNNDNNLKHVYEKMIKKIIIKKYIHIFFFLIYLC